MEHCITLPNDLARLTIGNRVMEFWVLRGKAMGSRTFSETHVSSRRNGYGQVSQIDSEIVRRGEFFLAFESGHERAVSLPGNTSFKVRDGHPVSLVCMRLANQPQRIIHMGVRNEATGDTALIYDHLLIRRLGGLDDSGIQVLANLLVLFTLGLGLIPLAMISQRCQTKFGQPLAHRVRSILNLPTSVLNPVSATAA